LIEFKVKPWRGAAVSRGDVEGLANIIQFPGNCTTAKALFSCRLGAAFCDKIEPKNRFFFLCLSRRIFQVFFAAIGAPEGYLSPYFSKE
jgi:hypothetical protein